MWEMVASALLIHVGKTAVDKFWSNRSSPNHAVVNQTGQVSYAGRSAACRTVIRQSAAGLRRQQSGTLFGSLYLPGTLQDRIQGDEIVLVLVIREDNQQVYLFETDMGGYEIDLPLGTYSISVFMVDPEEDDLFQAEIYAIGLPTAEGVDLTGIESLSAQSYDDMHSLVSDAPVHVIPGRTVLLGFRFRSFR